MNFHMRSPPMPTNHPRKHAPWLLLLQLLLLAVPDKVPRINSVKVNSVQILTPMLHAAFGQMPHLSVMPPLPTAVTHMHCRTVCGYSAV